MLCGCEFSPERDSDTGEESALAAVSAKLLTLMTYPPVRPAAREEAGEGQGGGRTLLGRCLGHLIFPLSGHVQAIAPAEAWSLASSAGSLTSGESILGVGCEGRRRSCFRSIGRCRGW